jgi:hypothetical protein
VGLKRKSPASVNVKTKKAWRTEVEVNKDEIAVAGMENRFSNLDMGGLIKVAQSSAICYCIIRY